MILEITIPDELKEKIVEAFYARSVDIPRLPGEEVEIVDKDKFCKEQIIKYVLQTVCQYEFQKARIAADLTVSKVLEATLDPTKIEVITK